MWNFFCLSWSEDNGLTCFAKSCIHSSSLYQFWFLDVSWQCEYICFDYQFFKWNLVPMHIAMGLFEMNETTKQSMVIQFWFLLERFHLLHRLIAFVKDEGIDLIVMATTLHSIVDCKLLKFFNIYNNKCFGHVMFKVY